MNTTTKIAPGMRQYLPLPYGLVSQLRRDPAQFCLRSAQKYGDVFRLQIGPWVSHLVSHPDHVRQVLVERSENYPRSRYFGALRWLVGETLLVIEGDAWRTRRRASQPAFSQRRLISLMPLVSSAAKAMLGRWRTRVNHQGPIEVVAESSRLMLDILARTLLGVDLGDRIDLVVQSLDCEIDYINYRFTHPLSVSSWVPTRRNRRFHRASHEIQRVISDIIEARVRISSGTDDLLSLLINARQAGTRGAITERQLSDEVRSALAAGYSTMAPTLAWTWYLLAQHPEVERRWQMELDEVLAGRTPQAEDIPKLEYTKMVIEESLRLYPAAWAMPRQAIDDDEIGGYRIPAGSNVVVSSFVTHRHPALWEHPDRFDPERFRPDRASRRPRFAFFPFGEGPHQCIGKQLMMMSAPIILATIGQACRLTRTSSEPVEAEASLSLRPRPPLFLKPCMLHDGDESDFNGKHGAGGCSAAERISTLHANVNSRF